MAWAATVSSIASTLDPSETVSASLLADSGAIVMRSSIPSAFIELTSSKETGWANVPRLGGERLRGYGELRQGILAALR